MYEDCLDYDNFPSVETDNFEDCNNLEGISISKLIIGQLYKISEGPLAGNTGKIVEMKKNKVKLELESLGMTVILKPLAA